jgi:hypothetical protein
MERQIHIYTPWLKEHAGKKNSLAGNKWRYQPGRRVLNPIESIALFSFFAC